MSLQIPHASHLVCSNQYKNMIACSYWEALLTDLQGRQGMCSGNIQAVLLGKRNVHYLCFQYSYLEHREYVAML